MNNRKTTTTTTKTTSEERRRGGGRRRRRQTSSLIKDTKNKAKEQTNKRVAKLEALTNDVVSATSLSDEWGSGGTNFLVEIEEVANVSPRIRNMDYLNNDESIIAATTSINGTDLFQGPKVIVRTEEVLIVGLVLVLWVAAIMLFFNRWGKIRMLEPYQPKFQQQHRPSCPLVELDAVQHQRASVSRMSMGMVHNSNIATYQFGAFNPSVNAQGLALPSRPRQNSVFVGPSPNLYFMQKAPRKTRSAMDLHSMVLDESAEMV